MELLLEAQLSNTATEVQHQQNNTATVEARKTKKLGTLRQGDVLLVPVGELPPAAATIQQVAGWFFRGNSQTANEHKMATSQIATLNNRTFVLGGAPLTHAEHQPVDTLAGVWYEVIIQRQFDPWLQLSRFNTD